MGLFRLAVIVVILGLLFGVVFRLARDDMLRDQAYYCEMVKAGVWPDYQGTYQHECQKPTSGLH